MSAAEPSPLALTGLLDTCAEALDAADRLLAAAKGRVGAMVSRDGRVDAALLEANQFAAHGLAWLATYVEALREMRGWALALREDAALGELETLMLQAAYGEYLGQIAGGIAMSQGEVVRPADFGLSADDTDTFHTPGVRRLIADGNTAAVRNRIAELVADGVETGYFGNPGLDETLGMVRDQFRRFSEDRVVPNAHGWHLCDELIPITIVEEMSELGVFGLTIPEEYGGLGMGKTAMCVVSEELSRGYIGVGSLGTRSEIAAELILGGGTEAQKRSWLPRIASGEVLPTAVFTEPNTGSDLGRLRTRAVRDGGVYRVNGAKT